MTTPDEDREPTMRRVRAKGRMPTRNFDCYFDGHSYSLTRGKRDPLDKRVLNFVRQHRDCSARDVRSAITGARTEDINAMILTLLEARRLENVGTAKAMRLRIPDFRPADLVHSRTSGNSRPHWDGELDL